MSRKAVFLDKDGTLVQDVPYNVDPALLEFTPHAIEGLTRLRDDGYELVVVSNQSGIARGLFTEAAFVRLAVELMDRLSDAGVAIAGFYYCGHHPDGVVPGFARSCDCRKPSPGLISRSASELDLDLAHSYLVGDILDDVEAGQRAGVRTCLLIPGGETEWLASPDRTPDFCAGDLEEAAALILDDARSHLRRAHSTARASYVE